LVSSFSTFYFLNDPINITGMIFYCHKISHHVEFIILFLFLQLQKLVNETFQSMWFTPVKANSKELAASRLLQRVMNITDVVAACRDSGFEWLEQLLENVSQI
jgi:hypothetical protein